MKFLEEIEKLLKRKLPRATASQVPIEDSQPAHSRDRRREREHRHERGRHDRSHSPQAAKPPSIHPASSGFDFSKPYEPAAPAPATEGAPPAPPRSHDWPAAGR